MGLLGSRVCGSVPVTAVCVRIAGVCMRSLFVIDSDVRFSVKDGMGLG